jgi:UDP-2,3-diacylglucosamine pyrophosphatase LpxH
MDQLAQLHVVSDLHLGGPTGRQMFDQGPVLAALIDHVGQLEPTARVGLVLDGDIVDFLAEEGAVYLDPLGAVEKLRRIMDDDAFRPVFDALRRFTALPQRVLVLILGNHDVELALPDVQEELLARVCADDASRGRVRVAMDGTGWACLVGGRRVLCTHGNEVDTWNPIDALALREVVRSLKEGAEPKAWDPNAGTRLVIDVINKISVDLPMTELLKPENTAVPAVVFALDPGKVAGPLTQAAPILLTKAWDWVKMATGLMGGGPAAPPDDPGAALRMVLAGGPVVAPPDPAAASADPRAGQAAIFASLDPNAPPAAAPASGNLGGVDVPLRDALQRWLGKDRTFEVDEPDDTFTALDARVAPGVDFVIAGHTHLERALPRKQGAGFYLNTGTWIRLLRITSDKLVSDDAFEPVLDAFRAGTMGALDTVPGLVLRRNTVASVVATGGQVVGSIGHTSLAGGAATIDTLPASVFKLPVRA